MLPPPGEPGVGDAPRPLAGVLVGATIGVFVASGTGVSVGRVPGVLVGCGTGVLLGPTTGVLVGRGV